MKKGVGFGVAGLVGLAIFLGFTLYALRYTLPAFAQNCQVNNRSDALVSSPTQTFGSKFGNSAGTCVVGTNQAALPTFQIPSYSDLKSKYFDRSNLPSGQVVTINHAATQSDLATYLANNDSLIWVQGDLNLSGNVLNGAQTPHTGVVFVDGVINIGPLGGGSTNFTYGDYNTGLVLISKNGVFIDKSVLRVDAVIFSSGFICTASTSAQTCPNGTLPPARQPLVVNGSLISLGYDPLNPDTAYILFKRILLDNSIAAEQVYQQPKFLGILAHSGGTGLQSLMSDTITLTTEGTNYAINFGALASVTLSGPTTTQYDGIPYILNWTSTQGIVSCSATTSGPANTWSGSGLPASGTTQVTDNLPGTYVHQITCVDSGGVKTNTSLVTINVAAPTPTPTPSSTPNPLDSVLVSFWKFNETSGQTAADSVSSNNGTANGTTIKTSGCIRGNCRSFNGAGDLVNMGSGANLHISSALTLSAWVYPTGGSSVPGILDMSTPGGNENYALLWFNGNLYFQAYPNYQYYFPNFLTPNTWQHIVVTFSNGALGFYKNGVAQAGGAFTANSGGPLPTSPTDTLKIGYYAVYSTGYFAGMIDEAGIWNRVLSGNEIKSLYGGGAGINLP